MFKRFCQRDMVLERRDFVIVREDFKKALHCFTREFQGSVNIALSEEEALRNARQPKQWKRGN